MSVVLLILKIIGIILLVLIGFLLLILLSVLFVPVRYRIRGSSEPEIYVSAVVRWLFPLVSLQIAWEGKKLTQSLRILGIPISMGGRKEKKEKRQKPRKKANVSGGRKQDTVYDMDMDETDSGESQKALDMKESDSGKSQKALDMKEFDSGKDPGVPYSDTNTGATESQSDNSEAESQQLPSVAQAPHKSRKSESRLGTLAGKIKSFFQKVKSLPRMIKKKVAKLKETALQIWAEIKSEANRNVLVILIRELKGLLGHYLPGKLKAEVEFAMSDPAVTGQVLGVLSLFPVIFRPGVHITPDFMAEKMYFTGSFDMRGHVRAVHAAAVLLRIWWEPDVKNLIKRVRNRR